MVKAIFLSRKEQYADTKTRDLPVQLKVQEETNFSALLVTTASFEAEPL